MVTPGGGKANASFELFFLAWKIPEGHRVLQLNILRSQNRDTDTCLLAKVPLFDFLLKDYQLCGLLTLPWFPVNFIFGHRDTG